VKNRTDLKHLTGIVFLNKPGGISSNKALQLVKRHFKAHKAGHIGTLDPLACGILPICLGEATKFAHLLQASTKSYRVTAQLGSTTTTGDSEGDVLSTQDVPDIDEQKLIQTLQNFLGTTQQVPPMFSALKINGQPLYKLARQGVVVPREPRMITIESIALVERSVDTFSFKVTCSKGSYMRTLVEDLGHSLGCGAHMSALTRIKLGSFLLEDCVDLETVLSCAQDDYQYIKPINILKPLIVNLTISEQEEQALRYGRQVPLVDKAMNLPVQDDIGLISAKDNNLIGLGRIIAGDFLITQRLITHQHHISSDL